MGGEARRGQVAVEYLLVMGFAFVLLAPLLILYYTQATRLGDEAAVASAERAALQIAEAADTVYYLGAPSSRTIVVDLPKNVESVTFGGTSVVLLLSTSHGSTEQVAWSSANLTGSMGSTPGPHVLTVAAAGSRLVNITEG